MTCVTVAKTLTISRSQYKMLESDHPGSVGKILQNLLEKVEALSLQLDLPEKVVVLRAGSVFRNGTEESETTTYTYQFHDFGVVDIIDSKVPLLKIF